MCAPVTSPVISELSYSYTKRPLLHVVHHSVPSPIACSIQIVYTVCHTVRGWEGLQVCVCVCVYKMCVLLCIHVCVCLCWSVSMILWYMYVCKFCHKQYLHITRGHSFLISKKAQDVHPMNLTKWTTTGRL